MWWIANGAPPSLCSRDLAVRNARHCQALQGRGVHSSPLLPVMDHHNGALCQEVQDLEGARHTEPARHRCRVEDAAWMKHRAPSGGSSPLPPLAVPTQGIPCPTHASLAKRFRSAPAVNQDCVEFGLAQGVDHIHIPAKLVASEAISGRYISSAAQQRPWWQATAVLEARLAQLSSTTHGFVCSEVTPGPGKPHSLVGPAQQRNAAEASVHVGGAQGIKQPQPALLDVSARP